MALRIRQDGRILCAAMHPAEPGDTYLHDGISYKLTVDTCAIVTDRFHLRRDPDSDSEVLDGHGEWWWADEVPEGIEIDSDSHKRFDFAVPAGATIEGRVIG